MRRGDTLDVHTLDSNADGTNAQRGHRRDAGFADSSAAARANDTDGRVQVVCSVAIATSDGAPSCAVRRHLLGRGLHEHLNDRK
jgi:hypothetical protein